MIHQNNNSLKKLYSWNTYRINNASTSILFVLLTIFLFISCTDSSSDLTTRNNTNSNSLETSNSNNQLNEIQDSPQKNQPESINTTTNSSSTSSPDYVQTAIQNPKDTPTPTNTPSPKPNPKPEPSNSNNNATSKSTPIATITPIATKIPLATTTPTATPKVIPTATPTATVTPTAIPTATPIVIPTATATPTATPTATVTPTPINIASKITSPCAGYISPKTQPTAIPEPTPTITSFLNPLAYPTPTQTIKTQFARNRYSYDAKKYFLDIAFGPEYYVSGNKCLEVNPYLHKWTNDITIRIQGYPTNTDIETVNSVVEQLNDLTQTINISTVEKGGNIQIYFVPENQFAEILPSYIPTNWGFFWVLWDSKGNIYRSTILVDSSRISQRARNHLIIEEITQSLGLMKDSYEYIDSIFYQGFTYSQSLTPLDRDIVELLYNYDPGFISGTSLQEAKTILSME